MTMLRKARVSSTLLIFLASLLIGLAGGGAPGALAEKRVALVIGNGKYANVANLANPRHDAEAISAALKDLGFEVFGGYDLDRAAFVKALVNFGRSAEQADAALVYYAGHGLQINGQNYLVPTDAQVEYESEVEFSLVSLNQVLEQLERGSKTNIVLLDACRDNPFAKELSRTMGTRAMSALGRGLRTVSNLSNTFIAFATQPDNVAEDGDGDHSPFAAAILKHIKSADESLSDLMVDVRRDVIEATGGRQIPWDTSSLTRRFTFSPEALPPPTLKPQEPPPSAAPAPPAPAADSRLIELQVWQAIETSKDPAVFEKFLKDFPNGVLSAAARARIAELSTPAAAPPSRKDEAPAPAQVASVPPEKPVPVPTPAVSPSTPPQQPAPTRAPAGTGTGDDRVAAVTPTPPAAMAPTDPMRQRILAIKVIAQNYGEELTDYGVSPRTSLQSALGTPTPRTLPGARTLTTRDMQRIVGNGAALYFDVLGDAHATTIPGAIRLSALGTVPSNSGAELAKIEQLNAFTGRNREAPIVFFCEGARCWESYNAGLRAIAAGYRNVGWYRGGRNSWMAAGLPTR